MVKKQAASAAATPEAAPKKKSAKTALPTTYSFFPVAPPASKGPAQQAGNKKKDAKGAASKAKAQEKVKTKGSRVKKLAEKEDSEEESLKGEVAGFLKGFNYDTDSACSEPEGLDEIDDPEADE